LRRKRVLKLLFVTLFYVSVFSYSSRIQALNSADDLRVKALFLFNFANYVEWPSKAFRSADDDIIMCLYGDIQFGSFLQSVDRTLIGMRRLKILQTKERKDIVSGCQILFVSKDRNEELPDFFKYLKFVYILSVGDQLGFADKGGIINIFRTSDRMQFDINLTNASKHGLSISSELLSIAREVKRLSRLDVSRDGLSNTPDARQ